MLALSELEKREYTKRFATGERELTSSVPTQKIWKSNLKQIPSQQTTFKFNFKKRERRKERLVMDSWVMNESFSEKLNNR